MRDSEGIIMRRLEGRKRHENKPWICAITHANEKYEKAARLNARTAIKRGQVSEAIIFGPSDIDKAFYNSHREI